MMKANLNNLKEAITFFLVRKIITLYNNNNKIKIKIIIIKMVEKEKIQMIHFIAVSLMKI